MNEPAFEPYELMCRAKEGDTEAFGRLYELYYVPVFRYLYGRLRNKEEANDLAQSVFLKVYEAISRIEPNSAPLKYFFTVARNTLIDFWRKKKDLIISAEDDVWQNIPDHRPNQVTIVETLEISVQVREALEKLDDDDQDILSLKYFGGLSAGEIGEQLSISEAAVRQRQCRALKILKEIIEQS
jgi:RNA polymerase sigma-70 factor (ECF subfamily)